MATAAKKTKRTSSKKSVSGARRAPKTQAPYRASSDTSKEVTAPFAQDIRQAIDEAVAHGQEIRSAIEERIERDFTSGIRRR